MKYLLLAIVFITLLFVPLIAVRSLFSEQQIEKPLSQDGLWSLIQEWRSNNGFQPYTKDQNLCKIAEERVKIQLDDHRGLIAKYDYKYPSVISENLVKGAIYNSSALTSWLDSPAHKQALEHDYKYSCIATSGNAAVQIFSSCENGCP